MKRSEKSIQSQVVVTLFEIRIVLFVMQGSR